MSQKRTYTSMAKISRENRLRERKADKLARKQRRRDESEAAPVDAPVGAPGGDGPSDRDAGDRLEGPADAS